MLVLSRKKNEKIVINGNIVITVVEVRGDKIRIGIDAPKDVPVHRQEVYDEIKRTVEQGHREQFEGSKPPGGANEGKDDVRED